MKAAMGFGNSLRLVNGYPAYALRPNFAEWELAVPVLESVPITISARVLGAAGHAEKRPHVLPRFR
jgi:hypothetical protein